MNITNIISPDTLRQYEDLSVNAKPGRLSLFISKAQDLDLKPFLGYAFYYDFLSCFTDDGTLPYTAPQPYQDMFNGCRYTDRFGHTILYAGLVPALVYFTLARFMEADAIRYTAAGPVIKQADNAAALKPADITRLVQQQRSIANAHARDTEKFLCDNRQLFPLWQYNACNAAARQPGPRIRGVDKTIFYAPGSRFPDDTPLTLNDLITHAD